MSDLSCIAERLQRKLGLGDRPDLRRALYVRLERLVAEKGEGCYYTIATVVEDSNGKLNPGKFFAKIVLLRLMERGYLEAPKF